MTAGDLRRLLTAGELAGGLVRAGEALADGAELRKLCGLTGRVGQGMRLTLVVMEHGRSRGWHGWHGLKAVLTAGASSALTG